MATFDIRGELLAYREQGVGLPVVLVHGSASDYRTWHWQLAAFGERFRAVAYSRRFHWPNKPIVDGADYSMQQHVDDLQAVLHALGGSGVHLVGHSYGAFVSLLVAIRAPELVRTLVLAEPPVTTLFVHSEPRAHEIFRLLLTRPRTAGALLKFGATGIVPATAAARRGDMEAAMRVFGKAVLGADFYHRLPASRWEQVQANSIRAEFLGSGFPRLHESDVGRVRIPTLLVNGERSPRLFHRLIDRLQALLPDGRRTTIPGASHIMHEDNPAAYNAALLRS